MIFRYFLPFFTYVLVYSHCAFMMWIQAINKENWRNQKNDKLVWFIENAKRYKEKDKISRKWKMRTRIEQGKLKRGTNDDSNSCGKTDKSGWAWNFAEMWNIIFLWKKLNYINHKNKTVLFFLSVGIIRLPQFSPPEFGIH